MSVSSIARAFSLFLVAASGAALAQPFGPSGVEFRVNTTTTGYQLSPSVGMDANGGFLVVWDAPDYNELRGQRYSRLGAPLGGEFRVNASTTGYAAAARVAGGPNGRFVVAWEASVSGVPPWIVARRFQDGAALGTELRVDAVTTSWDRRPAVSANAAGDFVVTWGRAPGNSAEFALYARRFAASGAPQGNELHVSSDATSEPASPANVTRRNDGGFVVSWPVSNALARRYDASETPGPIFTSNDPTLGSVGPTVSVASDAAGTFVLTWGGGSVYARRYDANAVPLDAPFKVDIPVNSPPIDPRVASDSAGNFVVVWIDHANDYVIWARRYASSGAPLGTAFRVDAASGAAPHLAQVAMSAFGDFVVSWQRSSYPNSDIYARRYCATLAGDANGDSQLSVLDVFYLINQLFAGGPAPVKNADANGDGVVDVLDVFYLINALFAGGPGPVCAPFLD